ncbi:MAG: hypothetical protein HC845_03935 [Akkermansiaceae bacterium]|nr:hypothetical protein [Akkermansiaceae bacterium]
MFFDQNLTFRITEVIKHFYEWDYPELVCVHLIEKYPVGYQKGVDDLVWISDLSAEGGWIVFTVDRGKSSNIQPLPEICSNLKITHVLLGNELCKPSKLKQAIVECWEQIRWLSQQKAGSRARLREETTKRGDSKFSLHVVDVSKVIDRRTSKIKDKFTEKRVPKVTDKKTKPHPKPKNNDHPDLFANPKHSN